MELISVGIASPTIVTGAIGVITDDFAPMEYVAILTLASIISFVVFTIHIDTRLSVKEGEVVGYAGEIQTPLHCTEYILSRKAVNIDVDGKPIAKVYRGKDVFIPLPEGDIEITVYQQEADGTTSHINVDRDSALYCWCDYAEGEFRISCLKKGDVFSEEKNKKTYDDRLRSLKTFTALWCPACLVVIIVLLWRFDMI
jgi:hypothetical protein